MPRKKAPAAEPQLPLPPGLTRHYRVYRARAGRGMPWVTFGTDYAQALKAFGAWKATGAVRDTVGWLLDHFASIVCPARVQAKRIAQRTADDYARDAEALKAGLGHIGIRQLEPRHVAAYRDARAPDAPTHVRNELACLAAAMAWAVESGKASTNPCHEVARPSPKRRERLVTHEEYLTVYNRALPMLRRAMTIAVRTLPQPGDLLQLGPRNLVRRGEQRVLRFQRGKTLRWIEVEVVGELARVVDEALAERVVCATFIHRRNGKPYTVTGIGAMFRRACLGTPQRPLPEEQQVRDFGLRDLRPKGATDMYLSGVPIRHISDLLGHATEQMTRVYIKSYLPTVVRPNETPIVAGLQK